MIASKEGGTSTTQSEARSECCMCGDHGLSFELFRCKVCQFRSQHRYCSNQYPKAESYRVCNWCVSQKDDSVVEKTQNSSNSSSSCRNSAEGDRDRDHDRTVKNKKSRSNNQQGGSKDSRVNLRIHLNNPIKKQKLPEQSPASAARKRITTVGGGGGGVVAEESVMRKSNVEELSNGGGGGGITKQVFRNKVRRYKLLDEVSSQ